MLGRHGQRGANLFPGIRLNDFIFRLGYFDFGGRKQIQLFVAFLRYQEVARASVEAMVGAGRFELPTF